METIKNLNLKYVDENYYKEISTQADLKSSLNGINIKKQDLKRNNKDFKKKEYFKIKSDYTKNKLALVSLKEGRKNKIKKILYELDREIFVLKKKETKNYVSENKKILKTKFDEEKRLLSFSLNNEEKIKEYILLLEKKYHKDLANLEKYSFSENTNVMINKIKQEKYAEIKDIDLNFKIKRSELKKNLLMEKKKFYKN